MNTNEILKNNFNYLINFFRLIIRLKIINDIDEK